MTARFDKISAEDAPIAAFDAWLRTRFVELNTELEEKYFSESDRTAVRGIGDATKTELLSEGRALISAVCLARPMARSAADRYELLGNVGFFMAACRRHELTESNRESCPLEEAATLALSLGSSLGVAPRCTTVHLQFQNRAIDGAYKCFTSLEAERVFTDFNTRAQLAYMRAADALLRIRPLNICHPVAYDLLVVAEQALCDVRQYNDRLYDELDVDRFFYCVRPYFRPYRVGAHEYRGANAGDFAGINEIDLLLGLCRMDDPTYARLITEKMPYLSPADQQRLQRCTGYPSFLDALLSDADRYADRAWFVRNAAQFLRVCEAYGETAAQHHERLVARFIEKPTESLPAERLEGITASGPPLPALLRTLEGLAARRQAVDRDDIPSRHDDLDRLRTLVELE